MEWVDFDSFLLGFFCFPVFIFVFSALIDKLKKSFDEMCENIESRYKDK